jgi:hypothetical protein
VLNIFSKPAVKTMVMVLIFDVICNNFEVPSKQKMNKFLLLLSPPLPPPTTIIIVVIIIIYNI